MEFDTRAIESLNSFQSLKISIDSSAEDHKILNKIRNLNVFPQLTFKKHNHYTLTCKNKKLGFLFGNQHLICIDYFSKENIRRRRTVGKNSIFFKSLGLSTQSNTLKDLYFYDLTTGLAQDAFLILGQCKKLILVERNPIVYIMLHDAFSRLIAVSPQFENQFELVFAEAQNYLNSLSQFPHKSLVFFDFMFESKKSKSNKNICFLKHITQKDPINNKTQLINQARKKLPTRLILKTKSPFGIKPQGVYKGQIVQYMWWCKQTNVV